MQIEKAITAAIISLGIIGSAGLASAGRLDQVSADTGSYSVTRHDADALGALQLVNHSQDTLPQMLGM